MSNFKIVGNSNVKLGSHSGLFTRQYQEVRAVYDAKIRNWDIEYKDDSLFYITDSNGGVNCCYFDNKIKNCDCLSFSEQEVGTCMHIEAIRLLGQHGYSVKSDISPLTYVDSNFKIQQSGKGLYPTKTPAVSTFLNLRKTRTLPYCDLQFPTLNALQGITLFDFQQEACKSLIKNMKSCLCLKMGLGKTICALTCCKLLNKDKIIVIAPNSLKYQWKSEIERFQLGSCLLADSSKDLVNYTDQKFLILSYEMLNFNKQILDLKFDILIADEIQKIKNRESVSWKTMSQVKSDFVFALSGTPIQNTITDLTSLIEFLNPFELKPDWKFHEDYCLTTRSRVLGLKENVSSFLRKKLDRYIINPKIDYTKFKLPTKNVVEIKTDLDDFQREMHDTYFESAQLLIAKSMNSSLTFGEKGILNGLLTKARLASSDGRLLDPLKPKSEKFQQIEDLIATMHYENKKLVIYSDWIKSLDLLIPFMDQRGIKYCVFNGTLSAKKRHKELSRFLGDPDVSVFLSTDTGGLGVDGLQLVCCDVLHLEIGWNPGKIDQRNGRLVRALQKSPVVNCFNMKTRSGIDDFISGNHVRKNNLISEMLGVQEEVKINEEDDEINDSVTADVEVITLSDFD